MTKDIRDELPNLKEEPGLSKEGFLGLVRNSLFGGRQKPAEFELYRFYDLSQRHLHDVQAGFMHGGAFVPQTDEFDSRQHAFTQLEAVSRKDPLPLLQESNKPRMR